MSDLPRHGSPADRGSADAYYWRKKDPHYYIGDSYFSQRISKENMTDEEIREYIEAYDNETDRKNYL